MKNTQSQGPLDPDSNIHDLFQRRDLEYVVAALLLLDKLSVDSVLLYRGSPVVELTLLGRYKTLHDDKINDLVDFLDKNGDMTIDDFFTALNKKIKRGRR
ncbi:hypothetical protein D7Z54_01310 [Salibacterium salarium]|uniref:Uncharacterized protein n=1 Tax=Salibacterium salarium TaxID=284579 RepID=A0A3R9PPA2_9BACI|nr:hypothetical protein [Salibacterium salarium]RSL35235.1 hypothetical protein D7Z54_01310 [Salibacterium salarium]